MIQKYVKIARLEGLSAHDDERLRFTQILPGLGEWELGAYFTLTQHDIKVIQRHRRDYNRLGFAVQLYVLRFLGWPLSDVNDIPEIILQYIAKQN